MRARFCGLQNIANISPVLKSALHNAFVYFTFHYETYKLLRVKIPRSARACPSIFSQLYLRKIKIHALKSLCVGLYAMLFRLLPWHFKMLRKNRVVSKAGGRCEDSLGCSRSAFKESAWYHDDFSKILRSLDFFVTFCIKTKSYIKKLELLFLLLLGKRK